MQRHSIVLFLFVVFSAQGGLSSQGQISNVLAPSVSSINAWSTQEYTFYFRIQCDVTDYVLRLVFPFDLGNSPDVQISVMPDSCSSSSTNFESVAAIYRSNVEDYTSPSVSYPYIVELTRPLSGDQDYALRFSFDTSKISEGFKVPLQISAISADVEGFITYAYSLGFQAFYIASEPQSSLDVNAYSLYNDPNYQVMDKELIGVFDFKSNFDYPDGATAEITFTGGGWTFSSDAENYCDSQEELSTQVNSVPRNSFKCALGSTDSSLTLHIQSSLVSETWYRFRTIIRNPGYESNSQIRITLKYLYSNHAIEYGKASSSFKTKSLSLAYHKLYVGPNIDVSDEDGDLPNSIKLYKNKASYRKMVFNSVKAVFQIPAELADWSETLAARITYANSNGANSVVLLKSFIYTNLVNDASQIEVKSDSGEIVIEGLHSLQPSTDYEVGFRVGFTSSASDPTSNIGQVSFYVDGSENIVVNGSSILITPSFTFRENDEIHGLGSEMLLHSRPLVEQMEEISGENAIKKKSGTYGITRGTNQGLVVHVGQLQKLEDEATNDSEYLDSGLEIITTTQISAFDQNLNFNDSPLQNCRTYPSSGLIVPTDESQIVDCIFESYQMNNYTEVTRIRIVGRKDLWPIFEDDFYISIQGIDIENPFSMLGEDDDFAVYDVYSRFLWSSLTDKTTDCFLCRSLYSSIDNILVYDNSVLEGVNPHIDNLFYESLVNGNEVPILFRLTGAMTESEATKYEKIAIFFSTQEWLPVETEDGTISCSVDEYMDRSTSIDCSYSPGISGHPVIFFQPKLTFDLSSLSEEQLASSVHVALPIEVFLSDDYSDSARLSYSILTLESSSQEYIAYEQTGVLGCFHKKLLAKRHKKINIEKSPTSKEWLADSSSGTKIFIHKEDGAEDPPVLGETAQADWFYLNKKEKTGWNPTLASDGEYIGATFCSSYQFQEDYSFSVDRSNGLFSQGTLGCIYDIEYYSSSSQRSIYCIYCPIFFTPSSTTSPLVVSNMKWPCNSGLSYPESTISALSLPDGALRVIQPVAGLSFTSNQILNTFIEPTSLLYPTLATSFSVFISTSCSFPGNGGIILEETLLGSFKLDMDEAGCELNSNSQKYDQCSAAQLGSSRIVAKFSYDETDDFPAGEYELTFYGVLLDQDTLSGEDDNTQNFKISTSTNDIGDDDGVIDAMDLTIQSAVSFDYSERKTSEMTVELEWLFPVLGMANTLYIDIEFANERHMEGEEVHIDFTDISVPDDDLTWCLVSANQESAVLDSKWESCEWSSLGSHIVVKIREDDVDGVSGLYVELDGVAGTGSGEVIVQVNRGTGLTLLEVVERFPELTKPEAKSSEELDSTESPIYSMTVNFSMTSGIPGELTDFIIELVPAEEVQSADSLVVVFPLAFLTGLSPNSFYGVTCSCSEGPLPYEFLDSRIIRLWGQGRLEAGSTIEVTFSSIELPYNQGNALVFSFLVMKSDSSFSQFAEVKIEDYASSPNYFGRLTWREISNSNIREKTDIEYTVDLGETSKSNLGDRFLIRTGYSGLENMQLGTLGGSMEILETTGWAQMDRGVTIGNGAWGKWSGTSADLPKSTNDSEAIELSLRIKEAYQPSFEICNLKDVRFGSYSTSAGSVAYVANYWAPNYAHTLPDDQVTKSGQKVYAEWAYSSTLIAISAYEEVEMSLGVYEDITITFSAKTTDEFYLKATDSLFSLASSNSDSMSSDQLLVSTETKEMGVLLGSSFLTYYSSFTLFFESSLSSVLAPPPLTLLFVSELLVLETPSEVLLPLNGHSPLQLLTVSGNIPLEPITISFSFSVYTGSNRQGASSSSDSGTSIDASSASKELASALEVEYLYDKSFLEEIVLDIAQVTSGFIINWKSSADSSKFSPGDIVTLEYSIQGKSADAWSAFSTNVRLIDNLGSFSEVQPLSLSVEATSSETLYIKVGSYASGTYLVYEVCPTIVCMDRRTEDFAAIGLKSNYQEFTNTNGGYYGYKDMDEPVKFLQIGDLFSNTNYTVNLWQVSASGEVAMESVSYETDYNDEIAFEITLTFESELQSWDQIEPIICIVEKQLSCEGSMRVFMREGVYCRDSNKDIRDIVEVSEGTSTTSEDFSDSQESEEDENDSSSSSDQVIESYWTSSLGDFSSRKYVEVYVGASLSPSESSLVSSEVLYSLVSTSSFYSSVSAAIALLDVPNLSSISSPTEVTSVSLEAPSWIDAKNIQLTVYPNSLLLEGLNLDSSCFIYIMVFPSQSSSELSSPPLASHLFLSNWDNYEFTAFRRVSYNYPGSTVEVEFDLSKEEISLTNNDWVAVMMATGVDLRETAPFTEVISVKGAAHWINIIEWEESSLLARSLSALLFIGVYLLGF